MMPISRRNLLSAAAVLGLATTVGCSQRDQGGQGITIGLTYIPNVQFAPFYVAMEKKLFSARGLDVTLRHHGAQEDLFGALLAGREQVVCASSDEAMVTTSRGSGVISTFATMYQHHPVCIVARTAGGISTVKDLVGRRVGLPGRSGSTYYGLLAALAGVGLSEADIQLIEIGYTGIAALSGDKVDAVVGFANNEPVVFGEQGIEVTVLPVVDPAKPTLVGPGLMTRKDAIDVETLRKLADSILEAERMIIADRGAALDMVARHIPDLDGSTARANADKVLAATSELWLVDGQPSVKVDSVAFRQMGDFLHSAGISEKVIDPNSVITEL